MKYYIQLSEPFVFVKPIEGTWTESPKLQPDAQRAVKKLGIAKASFIISDAPLAGYSKQLERISAEGNMWKMEGQIFTICNTYLNGYFPNKPRSLYLITI